MYRRQKAFISLLPSVHNWQIPDGAKPDTLLRVGTDYEIVDLLSFSEALQHIERGYGCARLGFTQKGVKWVQLNPGDNATLSHLELCYHDSYPNHFAGMTVPWLPSRCDLLERDWFMHPLAPRPTLADRHLHS